MVLNTKKILDIFEEHITSDKRNHYNKTIEFTLKDVFVKGKTSSGWRRIKNPKQYNPLIESPNPGYFEVIEFNDDTILLTESWGDGECGHLNAYYFNGKKVLFTPYLFGVY